MKKRRSQEIKSATATNPVINATIPKKLTKISSVKTLYNPTDTRDNNTNTTKFFKTKSNFLLELTTLELFLLTDFLEEILLVLTDFLELFFTFFFTAILNINK
tara:strand:- start:564 stop:872 length:309 start_codon:yes stop_codon:yes gene_type:complete